MFFRDSTQGDEDFANRWFLTGKPPVPGVKPALYNDSILLNVILGILTTGTFVRENNFTCLFVLS